jgi:RimJ/RimL family protein N-acetyltransferase
VLRPDYPLQTDRLILRPFRPDDLDAMLAIQSRPDVTRYLYWEPRNRAEVREVLGRKTRQSVLYDEGQAITLAVVWREVDALVGEVNLSWLSREYRQGEIGFVFHPDFHGKGLAREAAEVMLRLGFTDLGLHRIIGRCDRRNRTSAALLERLGMRREAHFVENEFVKGQWCDEYVYALLDRQWTATQQI